jgi:hypothetical protein
MADLQSPSASTSLNAAGAPERPWFTFFSQIGKRLSAFGNVATVTTADATNAAETQALVNELKAKVNAIIQSQQQ